VADDKKHMEDAEGRSRDREEVHGSDAISVVPEEGGPGLAGSRGAGQGAQVPRDAALRQAEDQAEKLAADAGRAPVVFGGHLPDEGANIVRQKRATGAPAAPGQPVPVDPETRTVPAHDRVWLDDGEALRPTAPEAAKHDPEESVGRLDGGASSTGQRGELLAQGQVLDHQVAAGAQGRAKRRQEGY